MGGDRRPCGNDQLLTGVTRPHLICENFTLARGDTASRPEWADSEPPLEFASVRKPRRWSQAIINVLPQGRVTDRVSPVDQMLLPVP